MCAALQANIHICPVSLFSILLAQNRSALTTASMKTSQNSWKHFVRFSRPSIQVHLEMILYNSTLFSEVKVEAWFRVVDILFASASFHHLRRSLCVILFSFWYRKPDDIWNCPYFSQLVENNLWQRQLERMLQRNEKENLALMAGLADGCREAQVESPPF